MVYEPRRHQLLRQNQSYLSERKFDRIIRRSQEVERGSIGMILNYVARDARRSYVEEIAERQYLKIIDINNWDLSASRIVFEKTYRKYKEVRRRIGAREGKLLHYNSFIFLLFT